MLSSPLPDVCDRNPHAAAARRHATETLLRLSLLLPVAYAVSTSFSLSPLAGGSVELEKIQEDFRSGILIYVYFFCLFFLILVTKIYH